MGKQPFDASCGQAVEAGLTQMWNMQSGGKGGPPSLPAEFQLMREVQVGHASTTSLFDKFKGGRQEVADFLQIDLHNLETAKGMPSGTKPAQACINAVRNSLPKNGQ